MIGRRIRSIVLFSGMLIILGLLVIYLSSFFKFCPKLGDIWKNLACNLCKKNCLIQKLSVAGSGEIISGVGFACLLFSWLLQVIKDSECGVEMGCLYKKYFGEYILALYIFLLFTTMGIYICNLENISCSSRAMILFLLVGLLFYVLYMFTLCNAFIFSQKQRKKYAHNYLFDEILSAWYSEAGFTSALWLTSECDKIIEEIPECASWTLKQRTLKRRGRYNGKEV